MKHFTEPIDLLFLGFRFLCICLFVVSFTTLLMSCEEDAPRRDQTPSPPRLVVPGSSHESSAGEDDRSKSSEYSEQSPKVAVDPDDSVLQVLTVNLDLDQADEQVLVLKKKTISNSPIRVAIVDFDSILNSFTISWENATQATSYRSFQLTLLDLTGDHEMEIVCTGLNNDGYQTIDAYHRSRITQGGGLQYQNIISIHVEGTIEIEETSRSQAYQTDRKNGISFPIAAYERDQGAENINDLLKTTYLWKHQAYKYVKVRTEKIPGKEIADRRLKELFREDAQAFEEHLKGPWSATQSDGRTMIMLFEPEQDLLTLYSGDVQEIYRWENSYRYLSNSISIHGVNELMSFIRIQAAIRLETLNTIRVTIYEINSQNGLRSTNEAWSGKFFRLSPAMQQSLLRTAENYVENRKDLPQLNGHYTSDTGERLFFDHPRFTLYENQQKREGTFSIYSIGNYILELRFYRKNGMIEESRTYKFDLIIEEKETSIIRTLFLIPGKIRVHGFLPKSTESLRFRQIESLEQLPENEEAEAEAEKEETVD